MPLPEVEVGDVQDRKRGRIRLRWQFVEANSVPVRLVQGVRSERGPRGGGSEQHSPGGAAGASRSSSPHLSRILTG